LTVILGLPYLMIVVNVFLENKMDQIKIHSYFALPQYINESLFGPFCYPAIYSLLAYTYIYEYYICVRKKCLNFGVEMFFFICFLQVRSQLITVLKKGKQIVLCCWSFFSRLRFFLYNQKTELFCTELFSYVSKKKFSQIFFVLFV